MKDTRVAESVCEHQGHSYELIGAYSEANASSSRTVFCSKCGDVITFECPPISPELAPKQ